MLPHHDGSPLYVSDQAPGPGDTVRVRVRVPEAWGAAASVHLRSTPDREPRFREARRLGAAEGWQWWEAEVEILNPVNGYRFLINRADGGHWWLNAAGAHPFETVDAEDFKLLSYPAPPDWAAATVMYQIFPDRFGRSPAAALREKPAWGIPAAWDAPVAADQPARSHQFYGGDLDGIALHLDHLERLGVTLL